jgi:hypothetical protein
MAVYDKSLIVEFLSGSGDDIITTGSANLRKKVGAPIVTIGPCMPKPFGLPLTKREELKKAFKTLTDQSRLYLRGHGDWKNRTLGGWTGKEVAAVLKMCGLTAPKLISVTGCNGARFTGYSKTESDYFAGTFAEVRTARNALLDASTSSFAGQLHFELGQSCGIRSDLTGRTYYLSVHDDGSKITADEMGSEKHHRPYSKIRFYWQGGQQMREWVVY